MYYIRSSEKSLYFTSAGVTFALGDKDKTWVAKLDFVGGDPDVKILGEDKGEAVFSFFRGKPSEWKTGIPTFRRIVYRELWPGIDLVYASAGQDLKYKFIVKPGAPIPARSAFDTGASRGSA